MACRKCSKNAGAASAARESCRCQCRCRSMAPTIYTPANCRKLGSVDAVAGTAAPGREISIQIGAKEPFYALTEDGGCYRAQVPYSLDAGFSKITVRYTDCDCQPAVSSWVYVDSDDC